MPGHAAGIDLGGTKVQGVIVDKAGTPLGSAVASTPGDGGPASVVDQVAAVVRAADVNAATLAEYRTGAGRGLDSLLAVFAGTGVGGAVVLGGRLHRGARGAAGELGHAVVVMGGERCPCGRRGCTEAYAGRTPMERAVRTAVEAGRATELPAIQARLGRARLTTDVLAEGLAAGDALAAELVELAARALGTAIASACNLLDVQGVLLGGGLTDGLGDPFVRLVERAVTPQLLANEPPLEIRRSALGDMAGAIGAALLVHEPPSPSGALSRHGAL